VATGLFAASVLRSTSTEPSSKTIAMLLVQVLVQVLLYTVVLVVPLLDSTPITRVVGYSRVPVDFGLWSQLGM
jgi:hypothetical protein